MDELVKDSVPVEEKKPLMESAWATATLLTARAARTTKRLKIKKSLRGGTVLRSRNVLALVGAFVMPSCVDEVFQLIVWK
jgi:hypothetical protein